MEIQQRIACVGSCGACGGAAALAADLRHRASAAASPPRSTTTVFDPFGAGESRRRFFMVSAMASYSTQECSTHSAACCTAARSSSKRKQSCRAACDASAAGAGPGFWGQPYLGLMQASACLGIQIGPLWGLTTHASPLGPLVPRPAATWAAKQLLRPQLGPSMNIAAVL